MIARRDAANVSNAEGRRVKIHLVLPLDPPAAGGATLRRPAARRRDAMSVEQHPQTAPALRASDRDRDEMLVRLHNAFAEGRLSEAELDERIEDRKSTRLNSSHVKTSYAV